MTTTALAFPEPPERSDLDRDLEYEVRLISATLADPTTDPNVRADLEVTVGTFDVFSPTRRPNVDPQFRAAMLNVFQNPPPAGGLWDAVYRASMNYAYGKNRKAV